MFFFLVVAQPEPANSVENQPPEDPPSSRFTWRIDNFSRMNTKKLYSDIFLVGGYKWYSWSLIVRNFVISFLVICTSEHHGLVSCCFVLGRRVLIFPKGNNVDHLSMYLDVADSATLPYGWSRYAQFSLAVVNQINPKYTIRKGATISTIECYYCPSML